MSMQHAAEISAFQSAAGCRPGVQRLRWAVAGIALALGLAACSSNDSSSPVAPPAPPPPPAVTSISGTVDEAFVDNATLTAYEVSSNGIIGSLRACSNSGRAAPRP